jgi:hypothetical protein
VGAGSLGEDDVAMDGMVAEPAVGAASFIEGADVLGDALATDGDVAEPGVGAGSLNEGADVPGDAVATDGDVAEPGVGADSFAAAEDASGVDVDPFSAAATAQAGVGAGSLSESVDVSAGDIAVGGALAAGSAEAIGIGASEAKAAAPSAMAETRRTLWVMGDLLFLMGRHSGPLRTGGNTQADRMVPPGAAGPTGSGSPRFT